MKSTASIDAGKRKTTLLLAGLALGMFAFGMLVRKRNIIDRYAPYVCIAAPILTFFLNRYSEMLFFGYKFGFELLLLNGALTFLGLFAISFYTLEEKETIL